MHRIQLKERTKRWFQKRNFTLNEHLERQIAYNYRLEFLTNCTLNSKEPGISNNKYSNNEIVVSLTTFGKRLFDVYLAIESIMQQTIKPNRIVLWLGNELENTDFPITLKNQQNRGLEIRFCKDIMAYTKLIPSLRAFPSAAIITIDDDNLYNFDLIENLINDHKKHPSLILCTRMHRIKLRNKHRLEKYKNWTYRYDNHDISPLNFPTGAGGVLYPQKCFNEEVFNEEVFTKICKYADDVWFKAMALHNNVLSKKIFTHNSHGVDHLSYQGKQDDSLARFNITKGMNDVQLKAVFDKYNLYEKLF